MSRLRGWLPSVLMAWRNLWRNRLRTILAALGIVIGVVAIAGLGITGSALRYGTTQQFQDLTNQATVQPGEDADRRHLTESQVLTIREAVGDANATVIPIKSKGVRVASYRQEVHASVEEVTHPKELYTAQRGKIPEPFRTGVLLNNETAARLNATIGDRVIVGDDSHRVRAIISEGGIGYRRAEVVVSPPAIADRGYLAVTIVAEDGDMAQDLANATRDRMNAPDEEVVRVDTRAGLNNRVGDFFSTVNLILLGIGSISLLVAGVSILNVMLMSTIERRSEIGVLRAVGVRRTEVLRMILTEATLLGVLGGAVGAALSLGIGALLYDRLYEDPTLVLRWAALRYVFVGFAFGAVASLLSGIYPAWKAANERPVEAIRS
ncbi:ABC transporter permease [Halomicrobium urmianum]|uniref:ABC transporter permease n=1 Tax=Halomicrobium urmianum TaxID=1586233 RepID=UPI001CD95C65|nr:ABC transporter permease [Halomicrobium urmianum]